jgi:hypothetical protein
LAGSDATRWEATAMPFPFYWAGALVAAVFLTAVLTVFGLLLKLMDRTATEVRESILPGLVSGMRDWADGQRRAAVRLLSPRAAEDGPQLDESPPSEGIALEHVQRVH